ncbi:MAG: hypothetical protein Q8781_01870 [Candidatus Phytoplasma stylosanthis]|uniref:hypothetical protein n=1 Tax=Candidatus Phytoplasma stylosanthis TaxID=2798314 RepID=UPI00293A5BE1|nr:hypothetical protein [Candidatus Phytoplasma stylosanthis]MDV3167940.1 hypothetical protein [Candidatus Phytoplasma stylosanthis]MDV3171033.1 hypothetical protein [Candidatus Phytoplasma stylosanthis]MDV3173621.1 hypothetical protein [Candidatus Phytoplasma stylosanthis]MDV3174245.1 hypothetical protein [Candidatus Phytoplasma stylosanthis]MDV3202698.1 hypothetical protein [Candidatus Phytoplasma stylosanthis]
MQEEFIDIFKTSIKRYNIYLQDKNIKYIKDILQSYNNQDIIFLDKNNPSYNSFGGNSLIYNIKKPPKGLIGVYLTPRNNIFAEKYQSQNNLYTLEELLDKNILSISEAFVFWDQSFNFSKEKTKIHLIEYNNLVLDNDYFSMEKLINNFLKINKIITETEDIFIKKNCYNIAPKRGIIAPLPCFKNIDINIKKEIDGEIDFIYIYFDEGLRVIDHNNSNINDLLKLSNGAKKIYFFYKKKDPKLNPKTKIPFIKIIVNDKIIEY